MEMKEFFQGSFKLCFSLKKILYIGRQTIDIGIVNIDINTTQDVYTYENKHGYEKNK